MIILIPNAGLCNRMRAIDSTIALSQEIGAPLRIYWKQNDVLNCRFHDLFEPIPEALANIIEVQKVPVFFRNVENIRQAPLRFMFENFQKTYINKRLLSQEVSRLHRDCFDFKTLAAHKNILIEAESRFFGGKTTPMYQYFKPIYEIEAAIQEVTQPFSAHTIGVHIRRSDNEKAINHSPLELFIQVMQKEISFDPRTTFFVASDSESTKKTLIGIFGDKLMFSNQKKGDRNTKEGMKQAVVDLYALSKTKKLLGSYWSSFSHTASHLSGIQEIIVRKERLPLIYGL
ncbi:MAG: hypothetical protein RIG62_32635 [Cyclobacteriaceae bacterium]